MTSSSHNYSHNKPAAYVINIQNAVNSITTIEPTFLTLVQRFGSPKKRHQAAKTDQKAPTSWPLIHIVPKGISRLFKEPSDRPEKAPHAFQYPLDYYQPLQ